MASMAVTALGAEIHYESYIPEEEDGRPRNRPQALLFTGGIYACRRPGDAPFASENRLRRAAPDIGSCAVLSWGAGVWRALPRGLPWAGYPVTPAPVWRRDRSQMAVNYSWEGRGWNREGEVSFPDAVNGVRLLALDRVRCGEMGFGPAGAQVDYWMARALAALPEAAARLPLIEMDEDGGLARSLPSLLEAIEELAAPWVATERLLGYYRVISGSH